MKVTEIMSQPVIAVTPETTVKEAARLLVQHGISALPVLNGRGALVGIISEADLMPIETRPDPRSQATPLVPSASTTPRTVAEVMTHPVITVAAVSEVAQAARAMLSAGVKRVPVMRGRRVVGIISRRDLMRVIARDDEAVREELVRRIDGLGVIELARPITIDAGVVTIELDEESEGERRLLESVALQVPGVLEVRFALRGPAQI